MKISKKDRIVAEVKVLEAISDPNIDNVYVVSNESDMCTDGCEAEIRITFDTGRDQCLVHDVDYEEAKEFLNKIKNVREQVTCPVCQGRGECQQTDIDWDLCRNCEGEGLVYKEEMVPLSLLKEAQEENRKLKFMIENGLGWEDMKNDITYPA